MSNGVSSKMEHWVNSSVILPILVSLSLSVALGPVMIPFLRKLKAAQTVRPEGPKSHLSKNGTPTMGGIIIVISLTATCLLYIQENRKLLPVLFMTLGFGLIGFLDDYIKVVLKRSMGLRAWQKMIGQVAITSFFLLFLYDKANYNMNMFIPFQQGYVLNMGRLSIPFFFTCILGTVNGTNFTYGLDGFACCVTLVITVFFFFAAGSTESDLMIPAGAVIGALLGFLIYNVYPARIFMGDTGSLALGGFVASMAFMMKLQLWLPIIAFIYLGEIVSVILQVSFFKLTKGKRLFRMTPIHHHFELSGFSEIQIVAAFTVLTVVMCLFGFLAI